ncbi:MAG: D-alanyl-D-alanine carboxypeptidase [Hungatella hathewayi]|nr:D-alanyl-D-alanine carboxypeptidase [Hungatella hathewayi]
MRKQMRKTGQIWKAGLPCLLSLCLFLGGCGFNEASRMSNLYSFEERPITLDMADDGSGYAQLFAENLCVIEDEGAFAAGDVTSEAGALFDTTGNQVLYSKNSYERLYPASITKVMTALLAVKYGNLSDMVTVTEDAVITESGATLCGIKPGDTLSMEQLLYGLMLPSGNDAGAAIAVHMSGSIPAFANLMNEEAKRLGATGTHFVNPHGLSDEEHYTTAYDLYLIFNEALKYPEFRQVTGTVTYAADYVDKDGNPVSQTWKGSNQFMTGNRETPEGLTVFSGKTGTTQAAGYCLIMATKDPQDREYISVVLKADSRPGLYDNMTNIIRKIVD